MCTIRGTPGHDGEVPCRGRRLYRSARSRQKVWYETDIFISSMLLLYTLSLLSGQSSLTGLFIIRIKYFLSRFVPIYEVNSYARKTVYTTRTSPSPCYPDRNCFVRLTGVQITGTKFCPDNKCPVNECPDNKDRVYSFIYAGP